MWKTLTHTLIYCLNLETAIREMNFFNKTFLFVDENSSIGKFDIVEKKVIILKEFIYEVTSFTYSKLKNLLLVGCKLGYLETFNFKSMSRIKLLKISKARMKALDICEYRNSIFSLSLNEIQELSLSTLKLKNSYKILNSILRNIKIVNDNILVSGIYPPLQVFNLKKLTFQYKSQNLGYYQFCFSISVRHGLIAYGDREVYLYSMKLQLDVCNRFLGNICQSLCFVARYLLCGINNGKVLYLDCFDLTIKKSFKLYHEHIFHLNSSNDLNILAYYTSKSFFKL